MSFANYQSVWGRPETISGLVNSALIGFWSATIVVALTFAAAWLVIRMRSRLRFALDALISVPLVFPGIVLGITILIEFLRLPFIPIYGTIWILVFAFLIRFMPYGMRFCHAGILAIHRELEECGRTCGAGGLTVLRRIVLPLALPSVVAAWLYVFLYTIRDLSMAILLAGPEQPGDRGGDPRPVEQWRDRRARRACGADGGGRYGACRHADVAWPPRRRHCGLAKSLIPP